MADIRLEIPAENAVVEILYDGTEIHQQPPSMFEKLTQLAHKIDFGAVNGESAVADENGKDDEDEKEKPPSQQPHWPFESARNKIRNALTEVSVLHDLLQIVKDKRYMVLDQVQAEVPDSKLYFRFLSLKKSLTSAASVLLSGAERLRTSQVEVNRTNRSTLDFHIELLRLRQNFKLKKIGNVILGDLSYKSAGSQFKHCGIFEVTKTKETFLGPSGIVGPGGSSPSQARVQQSTLSVNVPAELEGSAYIFVCIKKDEEDLCCAQLSTDDFVLPSDTHWQQKLERAQNVLFCKELFSQLAREAVKLTPSIPHLVVGNQITATIFPGIHLLIGLCHTDGKSSSHMKSGPSWPGSLSGSGAGSLAIAGHGSSKYTHEHDLEHSLHQLLHRLYHNTFQQPLPHPAYAAVGVAKKRRLAGPEGYTKSQILQASYQETLLEQIIRQVQHNFLRLRTMYVIDQLATELKDPLIVSHWNAFNSPSQSCVKIHIITQGYDSVFRSKLVIHIYEKTLKCICRDGKVMTMSFEPQELRNLVLCQISQHTISATQGLARFCGWTVLSSEQNSGVGPLEPLGNPSTVVLAAPAGGHVVALRSVPHPAVSVWVASAPRPDFFPSAVVREQRWEHLVGPWQEVRLDRMEGKNFLNKLELLLAALTP